MQLAQAGIAMLSLTYGFDPDPNGVLLSPGLVSHADMSHFYPQGNSTSDPSVQDEQYTAHIYGSFAYNFGVSYNTSLPKPGDVYQPQGSAMWIDYVNNKTTFVFSDSPTDSYLSSSSIYTNRTITLNYMCESHKVISAGNGSIEAATIGNISFSHLLVNNSITFFTNTDNNCGGTSRCSVVKAYEVSDIPSSSWYYTCNLTLGQTENDPMGLSTISDDMAHIATSSIAQAGFTDSTGQPSQVYPHDSDWGLPSGGDASSMGSSIATFAMGTIVGAANYNPLTSYPGMAPSQGVYLHVNHHYFFYLIIVLIAGCHMIFLVVVAILANRVMVGPDGHVSMSLLLRPIADALEGVSGGKENRAFRDAKRQTQVIYQKTRNGRWRLVMS